MGIRGRKWREAGGDCIISSFLSCTPTKYDTGDQVKDDELDGTCGTHGKYEKCVQNVGGKT